jgi:hypothetical protein
MKLAVIACMVTSLMLLCAPALACGTQLNPEPCQSARQPGGQFAPRFRPVPTPTRARFQRGVPIGDVGGRPLGFQSDARQIVRESSPPRLGDNVSVLLIVIDDVAVTDTALWDSR